MKILAIDAGSSSIKAAVLDVASARPVGAIARAGYDLDRPTPDAAELPLDRFWEAVIRAGREATAGQRDIAGVGLSCLMPALVLLDAGDQPLAPAWTHLDRRSRPVARRVWAEVGQEFFASTGNEPLPGGMSVICYRQMVEADASLPGRVRSYLHLNGWLGWRLSGEKAFDPGNACFTGLFETTGSQNWSARWCDYFGVRREWLPAVIDGRADLGRLGAEAASELGLPAGLPVKLGTADTSSAVLAAGLTERDLLHVVGTTQVLAVLTSRPRPHLDRLTRRLGVGDAFLEVAHNPVGGVALDWLRGLCFRDLPAPGFYEKALPDALNRDPRGVVLDPPFLGGDRPEIEERRAAFSGLTLSTSREDLLAALLRAMRTGHEHALSVLDVGTKFERIFLTGGGAEFVRQLIPAYTAENVHLLEEGSLCGIARLWAE